MKFFATIVLCALVVVHVDANSPKCSSGETGTGTLSDAAFWSGVDGGKLVEELTDENHDSFIEENPKVFVMYYHPGCGYCTSSKKAFAGAAKKLNKGGAKIVAAVDCSSSDNTNACGTIQGYPTFNLYKKTLVGEYSGARTTDGFVKYVQKN